MDSVKKCLGNFLLILAFPLSFIKPMGEVKVSEEETSRLNKTVRDVIWESNFTKSFLVWRRRLLCSSFLFYLVGISIRISDIVEQCGGFLSTTTTNSASGGGGDNNNNSAYVSTQGEDLTNYTTLGKVTLWSQRIAPYFSAFVILVAAWFWTDYRKSRNVLVPGWLLTILLSLWPMMIPLNYILYNYNSITTTTTTTTLAEKSFCVAAYALGVLPTYLSVVSGMTKGFKVVFVFSPSPLTGAMMVLSAIFSIIIPFAALASIVQLLGNYLLVAGLSFLVLGAVVILCCMNLFTNTKISFISNDHLTKCRRFLLVSDLFRSTGMALVGAWAIQMAIWAIHYTDTTDDDLRALADFIIVFLGFKSIIGMIFEFIGGMMFNAVLWTDIAVHISRNDDAKMQKLQSDLLSGN